jgi:hypothetical protein
MLPKIHFLLGLVFSLLLFPLIGWNSVIVLASTVLIDVDHYLLYVFRKKNFNLRKSFYYFFNNEFGENRLLCIFHTAEFWTILLIASFFYKIFFYVLLGITFHFFLDLFNIRNEKKGISIIQYFLKRPK